jgi:1-acyl-sn-glycerol-3-phosphate acyltransferase
MGGDTINEVDERGGQRSGRQRQGALPPLSPLLVRLFTAYARRYLQRSFHAVRLACIGMPPQVPEAPLIIYCNHPSWWDPLLCFVLAYHCFPAHTHYAPIAAEALARYRFFTRLGFFGVTPGTLRGAATLLRVGQAIMQQPRTALWMTPEGRFTDPRPRPVRLQPGLGHLASRLERGSIVPLALEYPFWEERFPEALGCFGAPVRIASGPRRSAHAWTALLTEQLAAVQDCLATVACQRDRAAFVVLFEGRTGVGGVYDCWSALRARLHGIRFHKAHGGEEL